MNRRRSTDKLPDRATDTFILTIAYTIIGMLALMFVIDMAIPEPTCHHAAERTLEEYEQRIDK
jgi:hypothetical protein